MYNKVLIWAFAAIAGCIAPLGATAGTFLGEGLSDTPSFPVGYAPSEGDVVTIYLTLGSFGEDQENARIALRNVITTINARRATVGNFIDFGDDLPSSGQTDFESVLLHEVLHAAGLGHPTLVENGLDGVPVSFSGSNGIFDIQVGPDGRLGSEDDLRGDDVNGVWFDIAQNNPFVLQPAADRMSYTQDTNGLPLDHSWVRLGTVENSEALGLPPSLDPMTSLPSGSTVRSMIADNVAMLSLIEAGVDREVGTADDFVLQLEEGPTNTLDCTLNPVYVFEGRCVIIRREPLVDALGRTNVTFSPFGTPGVMSSASITINDDVDWYFTSIDRYREIIRVAPSDRIFEGSFEF